MEELPDLDAGGVELVPGGLDVGNDQESLGEPGAADVRPLPKWTEHQEHGGVRADRSKMVGPKVKTHSIEGDISALNVPRSAMVFDLHHFTDSTAELLEGEDVATESIPFIRFLFRLYN